MTEYVKLPRENKNFGKALRALQKMVAKEKRFPRELLINDLILNWSQNEEAVRKEYEKAITVMKCSRPKGDSVDFIELEDKRRVIKQKFFNTARRGHSYMLISKKGP